MKDVIIYGAGGLGRDIVDIVSKDNEINILGFIDDNKAGEKIDGLEIFDFNEAKKKFRDFYLVLSFGDPMLKSKVKNKLRCKNVKFINIISKESYVSESAKLGEGCIIYPGVIIGSNARLKDHVLVCGNTSIGHDAVIENMCSITFNCSIGGNTILGSKTFVGSGSHIRDELKIGHDCVIGMNSTLVKNLSSNKIYYNDIRERIKHNDKEGIF